VFDRSLIARRENRDGNVQRVTCARGDLFVVSLVRGRYSLSLDSLGILARAFIARERSNARYRAMNRGLISHAGDQGERGALTLPNGPMRSVL